MVEVTELESSRFTKLRKSAQIESESVEFDAVELFVVVFVFVEPPVFT